MAEPARTGRVALRVAYDGTAFFGSQRQPGTRTVEGDLLRGLRAVARVTDPRAARFKAGSRTDRGVSAAANVFAVDVTFDVAALPDALNAHMEDAWVTASAPVPAGFEPRLSRRRAYRYFLDAQDAPDVPALEAALAAFRGTHDFSSFARVDEDRDPNRTVNEATATPVDPFIVIDIVGPSFLWNQVRRMVAAASAVSKGDVELVTVQRALADPARHGREFGLARPERLVLVDVHHDVPWSTRRRTRERLDVALGARARDVTARQAIALTFHSEASR